MALDPSLVDLINTFGGGNAAADILKVESALATLELQYRSLTKVVSSFYDTLIKKNQVLNDQIRSGSTVLASQLDLFDTFGNQVEDFGEIIDTIVPKVANLQKELERRTADIAGATTKITNEVLNQILINFNTVQGQSKLFTDDFEAILELATQFTSVISTFQIPEFQIPQEVRSVLQGDINNINTLIARQTALQKSEFELARSRGEAVDFLIQKFEPFKEAQAKFRESFTNSLSILEDVLDQTSREAGKDLFLGVEKGFASLTKSIEGSKDGVIETIEEIRPFKQLGESVASLLVRLGESIGSILANEGVVKFFKGFFDVLSNLATLLTSFVTLIIDAANVLLGISDTLSGLAGSVAAFLTIAVGLVAAVSSLITAFTLLNLLIGQTVIAVTGQIALWAALAVSQVAAAVTTGGLAGLFTLLTGTVVAATAAVWAFLAPFLPVIAAIAAVAAALVLATKLFAKFAGGLEKIPEDKTYQYTIDINGNEVIEEIDKIKDLEKEIERVSLDTRNTMEAALDAIKNAAMRTGEIFVKLWESVAKLYIDIERFIKNIPEVPNQIIEFIMKPRWPTNEEWKKWYKEVQENAKENSLFIPVELEEDDGEKKVKEFVKKAKQDLDNIKVGADGFIPIDELEKRAKDFAKLRDQIIEVEEFKVDFTTDASNIKTQITEQVRNSNLSKEIQNEVITELNNSNTPEAIQNWKVKTIGAIGGANLEIIEEQVIKQKKLINELNKERQKLLEFDAANTGKGIDKEVQKSLAAVETEIAKTKKTIGDLLQDIDTGVVRAQQNLDAAIDRGVSGDALKKYQKALESANKAAREGANLTLKTFSTSGSAFDQIFEAANNAINEFTRNSGNMTKVSEESLETFISNVNQSVDIGAMSADRAITLFNNVLNSSNLLAEQRLMLLAEMVKLVERENELRAETIALEDGILELRLETGKISEGEFKLAKEKNNQLIIENKLITINEKLRIQALARESNEAQRYTEQLEELRARAGTADEGENDAELKARLDAKLKQLQEGIDKESESLLIEKESLQTELELSKAKQSNIALDNILNKISKDRKAQDAKAASDQIAAELEINNLRLKGGFESNDQEIQRLETLNEIKAVQNESVIILDELTAQQEELEKSRKDGKTTLETIEGLEEAIGQKKNELNQNTINQLQLQLQLNEQIRQAEEQRIQQTGELLLTGVGYNEALLESKEIQDELVASIFALNQELKRAELVEVDIKLKGLDAIKNLEDRLKDATDPKEIKLLKKQKKEIKKEAGINETGAKAEIKLIEQRAALEQEIADAELQRRLDILDLEAKRQKLLIENGKIELNSANAVIDLKQKQLNLDIQKLNKSIEGGTLTKDQKDAAMLALKSAKLQQDINNKNLNTNNKLLKNKDKQLDNINKIRSNQKNIAISEANSESQNRSINTLLSRQESQRSSIKNIVKDVVKLQENSIEAIKKNNAALQSGLSQQKELGSIQIGNILTDEDARQQLASVYDLVLKGGKAREAAGNRLLDAEQLVAENVKELQELERSRGKERAKNIVRNDIVEDLRLEGERSQLSGLTVEEKSTFDNLVTELANLNKQIVGAGGQKVLGPTTANTQNLERLQTRIGEANQRLSETLENSQTNTSSLDRNTNAVEDNSAELEALQTELDDANRIRREAAGFFDESDFQARFRVENDVLSEVADLLSSNRDDAFENQIISSLFEQGKITKQMAAYLLGIESSVTQLSDEEILEAINKGNIEDLKIGENLDDAEIYLNPETGQIVVGGIEDANFEGLQQLIDIDPTNGLLGTANDILTKVQNYLIQGNNASDIVDGLVGTGIFDVVEQLPTQTSDAITREGNQRDLSSAISDLSSTIITGSAGGNSVRTTNSSRNEDGSLTGSATDANGNLVSRAFAEGTGSTSIISTPFTEESQQALQTIAQNSMTGIPGVTTTTTIGAGLLGGTEASQSAQNETFIRDEFGLVLNSVGDEAADAWNDAIANAYFKNFNIADPYAGVRGTSTTNSLLSGTPNPIRQNTGGAQLSAADQNRNQVIENFLQKPLLARDTLDLDEGLVTTENLLITNNELLKELPEEIAQAVESTPTNNELLQTFSQPQLLGNDTTTLPESIMQNAVAAGTLADVFAENALIMDNAVGTGNNAQKMTDRNKRIFSNKAASFGIDPNMIPEGTGVTKELTEELANIIQTSISVTNPEAFAQDFRARGIDEQTISRRQDALRTAQVREDNKRSRANVIINQIYNPNQYGSAAVLANTVGT